MKKKIRQELLIKRNKLSIFDIKNKSKIIQNKLFEIPEYKKANTILFYISYKKEVDTHDMIKKSILIGKNVIVPISDTKNKKLILSKLNNWENLGISTYNILEPKEEYINETSIENIDLIIVPGIGFDIQGYRIGHGLGYFDKLLNKSIKSNIIGIAFEQQIIKKIPIEKHDISVEKIITEKRIINCK
jgi:5-formyltetrahydrofolate cyclo-ligase